MEREKDMPAWWLLFAKSALFVVIGLLAMFANDGPSPTVISIVAGCFVAAGLANLVFAFQIRHLDKNYWWYLLLSLADIGFGGAIFSSATANTRLFMDIVGFWAMIYGAIQTTQAMYNYLALRSGREDNVTAKGLNAVAAAITVSLSFFLLFFGSENGQAWFWIGLHMVVLGVVFFLNTGRMRATFSQHFYNKTYHDPTSR